MSRTVDGEDELGMHLRNVTPSRQRGTRGLDRIDPELVVTEIPEPRYSCPGADERLFDRDGGSSDD
jgi:hypothetical protein